MKDLFSKQAGTYAQFRPHYPQALYDVLLAHTVGRDAAWDAGTGNGQAAFQLARYFKHVLATDISQAQLDHAQQAANIEYRKANELIPNVAAHSFDLITVGTALHWFDFDTFYPEVKRVAKPGALFAAWCYSLLRVEPEIDALLDHFSEVQIGAYWDPERRYVNEAYRSIPFPFDEVVLPELSIRESWTMERLEGYIRSWSSVQHYIKANSSDPLEALLPELRALWGTGGRSICIPLNMRAGRV